MLSDDLDGWQHYSYSPTLIIKQNSGLKQSQIYNFPFKVNKQACEYQTLPDNKCTTAYIQANAESISWFFCQSRLRK